MYFKRIELQGFKSFADPVTIDLNDGITCIVGPNGSGKSNISDALRWVLGEQSPKSLRGGKMDDIIFAGTATRKPKGMAEVSLVIDNSLGILPLEYNEVQVTRRMYRSGDSEYLINGNQCRLKDIKELFMDTGIGVDGYSIIGQGKIQDIVSTKPENRREIFEEAAGVVLYKSRKAEAERKLAAASDNLERVKDIISEIESRIGTLKEESEKASEYIVLRDRYKYVGVNIIIHNIDSLIRTVEASRAELFDMETTLSEMDEKGKSIEALIEERRLNSAALDQSYEDANAELLVRIDELNTVTSRGQVNEEKLQSIERELARLEAVISDNLAKLDSEKRNFGELEANEKSYRAEKEQVERELAQAEADFNDSKRKLEAVNTEIENSKDDIISLTNKNVTRRADITTLENYVSTLNDRRDQLNEEYSGKDETDAENARKLKSLESQFAEVEDKQSRAASKINEIVVQIRELEETSNQRNRQIAELSNKYNRTLARKNTIEEMESNYEGYNNAVRQLMRQHANGIVGTVSDLIKVPSGYEIATETALGAAMQNIVCDDDASAKAAVRWLKDNRAGRATFLPLSSLRYNKQYPERDIENSPGYLGIASQIVGADEKYHVILEYLLGRVIFASNMDDAVRISKMSSRGYRIVTTDGEVINSSGAITGGRYKNKSANILERKNEIKELSEIADKLREQIAEHRDKIAAGEVDVAALKESRAQCYDELHQIEIDKSVIGSEIDRIKKLTEDAGAHREQFSSELATLDGDIAKATEMVDKHRAEISETDTRIEKLNNHIEELMVDAERYDSRVNRLREVTLGNKLQLSEQDARILGLNELIERVRDTVTDLENEIDDARLSYEELDEKHHMLTSSDAESSDKIEELQNRRKQLEDKIKALGEEIDSNKAAYEVAISNQKELIRDVTELQDAKYKLEVKSTRSETLLDTQKDKLWDEFEVSFAEAQDIRDENFGITAGNKEAKEIKLRMAELGDVNISSIEEYKAVSRRYEFMTAQENDISTAMKELRSIISNMERKIRDKFKENFDKVVINFEEIFNELFGGGHAELRLEDESDPLASGIEIIAQPPGKRLKNINIMSGGEKTLTAIALMFAVIKAKPTPFCILDEVEAALDEANIERFSNYLKHFEEVQFALITHHKATMEHADVLYGVTMPEQGISRVLSLKFEDGFDPNEYADE